jgi:hypothetical protein
LHYFTICDTAILHILYITSYSISLQCINYCSTLHFVPLLISIK